MNIGLKLNFKRFFVGSSSGHLMCSYGLGRGFGSCPKGQCFKDRRATVIVQARCIERGAKRGFFSMSIYRAERLFDVLFNIFGHFEVVGCLRLVRAHLFQES